MSTPADPIPSVRRRCIHATCNRFVGKAETHCAAHRQPADCTDLPPTAKIPLNPSYPDPDPDQGSYRVLLDNDLRETLARATSEILDKGLIDELGALRVVLLRVLVEEHELAKLVSNITRIVTVAAQAMRVQHAVSGERATTVTESIGTLIESLFPIELPALTGTDATEDQP